MRKPLSLLVALSIALVPQVATAHYLSHADPEDTEGAMDIAHVRLRSADHDLFGKVVFFEIPAGWWDWDLTVDFDSRGDERMDFYLAVVARVDYGGAPDAALYRRGGRLVDDVRARFDGTDGELRFRFPEGLLKETKDVRWRVDISSYEQQTGTRGEDLAPDSGWYDH